MDIIRTSRKLQRTVKNAARLKEVISVFAKNGFEEFITGSNVLTYLPGFVLPRSREELLSKKEESRNFPQKVAIGLRQSFEELGPAFVKFGQLLSTREDLFPVTFIDEMKLLRDKVKGIDYKIALKTIETSLGTSPLEIFEAIESEPIGTASIGVVYKAILKDGTSVVLKVKRPGIAKIIQADVSLLEFLIERLEKISDDIKYLGLSRMLKDFSTSLQNELDFRIEAAQAIKLEKNLRLHSDNPVIQIPKIYKQYSSESLLVMECFEGVPFSNSAQMQEIHEELFPVLKEGIKLFVKTFLHDGFFHADLHGGNFFYLNNKRIGLIDFGLMGILTKKNRLSFLAILYALVNYNIEQLVNEFLDVADFEHAPDVEALMQDVRDVITPYMSLTVQEANLSVVLPQVLRTLTQHRIYLPREWFIVFRALTTLDGVGKSLNYDFDLFELLNEDLAPLLKSAYSKEDLLEDGIWFGRSMLSSFKIIPRHIKWFLKEFSKNNYAIEIKLTGHEQPLQLIGNGLTFVGYSFLIGVFVISGVLFCLNKEILSLHDIPFPAYIFWSIAFAIFIRNLILKRH